MATDTIYLDELVAAYAAASQPNDRGKTFDEIRASCNVGVHRLRVMIRQMVKDGVLSVGRRMVDDVSGRRQQIPCYIAKKVEPCKASKKSSHKTQRTCRAKKSTKAKS
jgi:hypothetical protein